MQPRPFGLQSPTLVLLRWSLAVNLPLHRGCSLDELRMELAVRLPDPRLVLQPVPGVGAARASTSSLGTSKPHLGHTTTIPPASFLCHPGWWQGMRTLSFEYELPEAWQRGHQEMRARSSQQRLQRASQRARRMWHFPGFSKPLFSHLENEGANTPRWGIVGIK